jgi:Ca2+-binding RTX toxin-like protein
MSHPFGKKQQKHSILTPLKKSWWAKLPGAIRANADSQKKTREKQRAVIEIFEPRVMMSADSVLGGGASTAIIESFQDYSSLVQAHIEDAATDFDTYVPGILLTQRDGNDAGTDISDADTRAPQMRDLLAVETNQQGTGLITLAALDALDTDNDTTVSWQEAFNGIIVSQISELLNTFDSNNSLLDGDGTNDGDDHIDGDADVDSDDVEQWVFNGLASAFSGATFPSSGLLDPWFDVDLINLSTSGSGAFNLSFTASISFVDSYQIDLGLAADAEEIELPQWQFNATSTDVEALDRNVSITGKVDAPIAVTYSGGPDANFAATGKIISSVKAGGDGTADLAGKIVNVGFLGTQATVNSEFKLSMTIETEIVDPSSPTRLGFADLDGDNTLAEKLAFEADSTGGILSATDTPDGAFNLATPILFDLLYDYQTGDSGPHAVSVDVSGAGNAAAVQTALQSAINATALNGLLTVSLTGGLLSIEMVGSDATGLGFTNGSHSDNAGGAPFELIATDGFDFSSDGITEDQKITFSEITFLLSLGGALPRIVTVAGGTYTTTEWEQAVQDALDAKFTPDDVDADLNLTDLNNVKLKLSANESLEIVDTDALALKMTAVNSITQSEISALDAAVPDQLSRLFVSTTDTANDAFEIKMNLAVRDGLDFTPAGTPQLKIDAVFDGYDGPFDLPNSAPLLVNDFSDHLRFALPMDNTDFAQYLDFNVFGRSEAIAMIQQLEGWATRLSDSIGLAGVDIPLVQSVLGQVLDFADMIHDTFLSDDNDTSATGDDVGKLLSKVPTLDADNPSIRFFTAQELGRALHNLGILELTGSGDYADYDEANKDILYEIDVTHTIANLNLPVDFTLDLAPLGEIYSDSNISLVAEGGFNAFLGLRMGEAGAINNDTLLTTLNNGSGVDIAEGPAITGALAVERVYGRLISDAHFNVTIGGVTYAVAVDADSTETNLTTANLIDDIKTALTTSSIIAGGSGTHDLNAEIDVVQVGDRIALIAKPGVASFSLDVNTLDSAYTQLGLQTGRASTVSVVSGPVANPAAGNTGVLTITLFGSAVVPLTIDNAAGNVSVTDLVNDINEKIAGSSLANKIIATRYGDRIVFSAIDQSVYGFSVAANATAGAFFGSFSTLNAWLTVTAANEPSVDSLARFGRLSGDATLTINGVAIVVDSDDTDGATALTTANGSLEDLVIDLNAKIAASSLGTSVIAEVSGTRLVIRANSSSVTSLTVTTTLGNPANTEMGFAESQTAGKLGVTGNRAAPYYYGPTATTSFRVEITGGSAATDGTPKTVTIDYPTSVEGSGGPLDLLTNATVYDLASDIQRALNAAFGSAAENPLLVSVDAGRLLFTIKSGSAGLGATDFNILANSATEAEERAISQLKLYDPTSLPIPASVNLNANEWDLLITDRDGTIHGVTLDGDVDIGDIIASINAATGTNVVASIGPLGNGLQLLDTTGSTSGKLVVRTVNGSNAAIDLGLYLGGVSTADQTGAGTIPDTPGLIIGDTIGTLALIDRVFLRQVDGDTPILGATFEITSDDPDTGAVEKIHLEANFGFVGVTATGDGTLTGGVGVTLKNGAAGRTTLRDLFSAVAEDRNDDGAIDIDDFKQVLNPVDFTLAGQFDFDVTVNAGGGIEALITDTDNVKDGIQVGTFSIVVADPGDVDVTWTGGGLGDLEMFKNIGFDDVLNALKQLADFLDDYAAFGFLNEDIPLIGINFNELVDLADRFRQAVEEIEQNPAGSVQLLEQKIREEFGLPAGVLTLALADGDDGDSDAGDMLKIQFNLGAAFSESLPVAFDLLETGNTEIDNLGISLEGQADLNATGNLDARFTIGIDLGSPLTDLAKVYLYTGIGGAGTADDDTYIGGSLSASANDLSFNAALGPVGVFITDGAASLNLAASLSSTTASERILLNSSALSSFTAEISGSADATLPVYFPTQSSYIGDISLIASFSATGNTGLTTNVNVSVPTDFEIDFDSFSIFDNLALLIDATDLFLSGVQDALDGQIMGFELPLAGDKLGDAVQFIEDFRSGFIKDLRNLVENAPSLAAETVQGFLYDLLHTKFDILADTDGDSVIDLDDVIIEGLETLGDLDFSDDYLQWNVLLGKDISPVDINVPFDLGFPALGLEGDIALDVTLGWELGIGLGISIADGAYIDVRRQDYTTADEDDVLPELQLTLDVNIGAGSNISGSLLFLQLDIDEAPKDLNGDSNADPTHFHAEFSVDLMKGEDEAAERLAFSDIGSLDFDLDLTTDAAVNLDLTLKFNEDLIGDSPLSAVLPEVKAHFALLWEWGLDDAESGEIDLSEGLKYIAFEDVGLDLGKFLGETIGPLVEKIQSVTEPFQPIIDIVTAAIPVLSDLAGEPVTLVDIAAAFGEFNPDLIYAVADLISLVNSIPASPGSLMLPFGDLVLVDNRDGASEMFGGLSDVSELADPNFDFGDVDSSTFSGFFSGLPSLGDGVASFLSNADSEGDATTKDTAESLFGGNFNRTGQDGKEYGFAFPIFEDPAQIFGLLLGRQATIVTYDLPPFVMDFSWKQSFPIYGPLWGVVTASVGMKIDLAFGYDTQGVADFFDSGFSNPLTLLGGLYIADTDNPAGGGVDVPELVFTGSIGVGAELNAGIASAGATVNIILEVDFDLYDPNHDDKVRIDELLNTFLYEIRTGDPALAPLAIFDISGEVSLQLSAFIEFLFARFDFDITPQITLFEFSIPFEREPFLATERDDGSLLLNIGDNAAARMNGDIRDLSEQICVEYIGNNQAKVWSEAFGISEDAAQIYTVDPTKGIVAYGGEGNDVIVVHGDIALTAEGGSGDDVIILDGSSKSANLRGGVGNDTLVGSGGADLIWGEQGDDIIHGRGGDDWLFGDTALISYGATGSLRVTTSDEDGNDIVWGGGDDDVIFGGGGNDTLAGDSDAIPLLSFNSFKVCGVTIDLGAIADGGVAGNDFIFGDGGRIDAAGGTETTLILNLSGVVDAEDQGRTKFAGIRLTDAAGGGNDNIFGQVGNDVVFSGSGDDQADGGANNDIIYGESGYDTLSGGADDDEIQGGLSKDFIFGFGAGPGDAYNDGGATDGDGDDLLFGDDGNDLIRGNKGNDTIYGGRGADVLFGDIGTDDIFGENEGDTVFGGAGSDYVEGGTGNDVVFGDDGLVIYFAGTEDDSSDDRVIGDALFFNGGDNVLFAYYDDGLNTLTGDDDSDLTLDLMVTYVRASSDGDDTVIGGEGDDIAFGGAGNDTLYGDLDPAKWLSDFAAVTPPPVPAGSDVLIGDGGKVEWHGRRIDKIESFKGVDPTEAGDDTISGNGGADRLLGGGGSDTIYGRMAASFADGGNAGKLDEDVGVDIGKEISDDDIVIGDDGVIDIARGTTKLAKINTTIYDPLLGETYADHLFGNWGRDIMLGGLGGDEIYGDTGLNLSEPRAADDIMLGDNGELLFADATIEANFGRLELIRTTDITDTTGGADKMSGSDGDDVILGGVNNGGEDNLSGDAGSDVMLGDNGELDFALGGDTNLNTLDLIRSYRDNLGGKDLMSGAQLGDVMIGGTGGDEMYGDDANASHGVADGEDIMLGDNADIFLIGQVGRLTVRVGEMTAGTAIDLITTTDTLETTGGADTMSGNAGNDIMLGGVNNGGQDMMYGDIVAPIGLTIGDDGDDILLGDNGLLDFTYGTDTDHRNTLDLIRSFEDGLGGVDIISGNRGLDVAIGGTAGDTIYGDDTNASAGGSDLGDLLLGDNADIFLVAKGNASEGEGDLKVVLDAAVALIRTTDEDHQTTPTGGSDTISGNAGGDIIAGGVEGDTIYGDRLAENNTHGDDGDDIILGDNGAFEWLSEGRLGEISGIGFGIDIEENNPDLWAHFDGITGLADTDLTTLDLVTTEQPKNGGRDYIRGDDGNDFVFGGTDSDTIYGDDSDLESSDATGGNDLLFGDHGRVYLHFARFKQLDESFITANFNSRNFFAIDIDDTDGGEGDRMWGEEGGDVMLGQQGDDQMWGGSGDDDMIGGHNVSGGWDELDASGAIDAVLQDPDFDVNDLMDGGSGDDAMAGDNAIIWRRGDEVSPRFRQLTKASIYTTTEDSITANISSDGTSDPDNAVGRDIQLLDHSDAVEDNSSGRFGADVMAGGADSDVMFGQLGYDLMQGDGNIGADDLDPDFITRAIEFANSGSNPDTDKMLYFNIPEMETDADDYMEGNGGSDLMYGGLGQDDMIGGSSALFGLSEEFAALLGFTAEQLRPDDADIIFGGAGTAISRNDIGSTSFNLASEDPTTHVITTASTGHARDADFIMGDNANIYRLVGAGDSFLTFNYDNYTYNPNSGTYGLRIIPRAMEQLDYHLGGADYNAGTYVGGAAQVGDLAPDNGAGDLIHGESGDDIIFGMTGSDVIFGEGQDDDIVGGYGNDWISGGTGQDGILGDDGLIYTSRNSTSGESLYGVDSLLASDPRPKYADGNVLNEIIKTPGEIQYAVINIEGELKKTVDIVPFSYDHNWIAQDDEYPDNANNTPFADDIIFGGLGSDWLHGASGDDAISGAEALEHAYVPVDIFVDPDGVLRAHGKLDLGYDAFSLASPINPGDSVANPNPGDVLAFNTVDLDGQHLNNRFRAGEFFLYDEYDPRRKILLDENGNLWKDSSQGDAYEFLLNFDETEGVYRPSGTVLKATGQQTSSYGAVNDDGKDAIFGDLGNDWLVGGTGRDNLYGGWGNDLLNADDYLGTNGDLNDQPDTHPTYEDRAYGGAGRDVLIGNTGGDRLIDWVGEYNSYLVPYAPFGQASVSRTLQPFLPEFLYALSFGDGADPTRPAGLDPVRNGEPDGELGLVLQKDYAWQDQTGAPADPQAGNIPGGPRDVLRSAGFNDGTLQGFAIDSGVWELQSGALKVSAASLGKDAAAVFNINDPLPVYYEFLASVKLEKPTSGWKANAFIVFDYQSETDFKFAGIDGSTNKLVMGHRTEAGWIYDVQTPFSVKMGTLYSLKLAVDGLNVTLVVNNSTVFSYTYQARVIDGISFMLNAGMVGVGSNNARGSFDNIIVQILPPQYTFQRTEDFSDSAANDFSVDQGTWQASSNKYTAAANIEGFASSLMNFAGIGTNSYLELSATLNTNDRAGFVFDYYSKDDFKFVAIDADEDKLLIGHYTLDDRWQIDAVIAKTINNGVDYSLGITLHGSTVTVKFNGATALSHVFNSLVGDGMYGLFGLGAAGQVVGTFDNVAVKTDDAGYAPASVQSTAGGIAALTASQSSSETAEVADLTSAQLQPLIQVAMAKWMRSGLIDEEQIKQLRQLNFEIGDLEGLALGQTDSGTHTITVDINGAGYGWFIDRTPNQDREFVDNVASEDSDAYGKMDLLSVLIHEIGHYLGFDHDDSDDLALMDSDLDAGQRLELAHTDGNEVADDHRPALFFDEDSGVFVPQANKHAKKHSIFAEEDEWLVV